MGYQVQNGEQLYEEDEHSGHNETESHKNMESASQAGGETKAKHPNSSLLSAKIIFSKKHH